MHCIKLAAALLIALMLMSVAALASGDANVKDLRWRGHGMGGIDTVYHTIQVTGMTGDSVTFNILNTAVKGKSGNVSVRNYSTPIAVQYYFSNDTAVIAKTKMGMKNKTGWKGHEKPPLTDYNKAALNVAGASAVMAAKNITMSRPDNNTMEVQLSAFSVYLPDGTVKSYKLDTPVKAVRSKTDKTMKITGNAQFRADLQDALKGGAKFPANAAPVLLKDIDAKM